MKKIAIIVGTRPEVIKLAPVYLELKKSKKLKPILINTGQHREMTKQMLSWFGIKEDINLRLMEKNQSLGKITSKVMSVVYEILRKIKPDLVMIEGDTATVMATSIAAFYLRIPVAHVEAGLRTNDIYNPFPEEMARRIVSCLATVHFAPTRRAIENLRKEGITENVYLTGNTVIDALLYTTRKISKFRAQNSKNSALSSWLSALFNKKYKVLLVTMHRRENFGKPQEGIAQMLLKLTREFKDIVVLLPVHKNPNVRNVILPVLKNKKRIYLVDSLDYSELIYAMKNCYLILTDSGGIQEEAPSLGKPVLVLRATTERPEGINAGNAKLVGTNPENIFKWTSKLLTDKRIYQKMSKVKNPYGDGEASKRIARILSKLL